MLNLTHGILPNISLASFGTLEADYNLRAATSPTPTQFKNTVSGGIFKDAYDFSGHGRHLPVPVDANCPIYTASDGASNGDYATFAADQWFERLTIPGVVVKSFAFKLKGIPSPLSTLNFCANISVVNTLNDALFLGNATGALTNETISYIPSTNTADIQATAYVPANPWFTLIINPVAKKIYIDGVERTLMQAGGAVLAPPFDLKIGQRITNSAQKFTGGIQRYAAWSTEITAANVPAIHELIK